MSGLNDGRVVMGRGDGSFLDIDGLITRRELERVKFARVVTYKVQA
jgi:hypothetical protein